MRKNVRKALSGGEGKKCHELKTVIPKFKSAREEVDWYDDPEIIDQMMIEALDKGTYVWVPPVKPEPTKLVSMRYSEKDITRARPSLPGRSVGCCSFLAATMPFRSQ